MANERKHTLGPVARIETAGFPRLAPPYGGTVEQLPASFWESFAEALTTPAYEETFDAEEWALVESARDLAYHCGQQVVTSLPWAPFVTPLDSPEANAEDAMHAVVATLGALGLDYCQVVEIVPFERLVVQVPHPDTTDRAVDLQTRGFCLGVMELAFGGRYTEDGPDSNFECRKTDESGVDGFDEYIVTRRTSD